MKKKEILLGGIVNNPVLVLVIGMCPTMAQTTSLFNAFGLGVATLAVLVFSNMLISALRKIIPDKVRIPSFILVIATLVTLVEITLAHFLPDLYKAIGTSIKLIVVNCIILGRAEAFANKNGVVDSILDGVSMGLGFLVVACIVGGIRELLISAGIAVFGTTAGGFIVLAMIMAVANSIMSMINNKKSKKPYTTLISESEVSA